MRKHGSLRLTALSDVTNHTRITDHWDSKTGAVRTEKTLSVLRGSEACGVAGGGDVGTNEIYPKILAGHKRSKQGHTMVPKGASRLLRLTWQLGGTHGKSQIHTYLAI